MNLQQAFLETRRRTVEICEPLTVEDHVVQAAEFASPAKWHLAHTTWFWEQFVLVPYGNEYQVFDQDFSFLFNSYYNGAGDRMARPNRGLLSRPSTAHVYDYRAYVDEALAQWISDVGDEHHDLIVLGINHEQQHQELLLTDIKYMLSQNPLRPIYDKDIWSRRATTKSDDSFHQVEAGLYQIGHIGLGFCFDNELCRHQYYLQDCQVAKHVVTNGAYLDFIEDGGYDKVQLWLDEGWAWLRQHGVTAPLYWQREDGHWTRFTLAGQQLVDLDQPLVHISYYEAQAFASWCGMRLATEQEWEIAADHIVWGDRWEWTKSAYAPYPGFKIAPGALGEYNGKFMVNQMVLRGSSVATSSGHSRKSYRNFFHPDARWQFSGIRLAK